MTAEQERGGGPARPSVSLSLSIGTLAWIAAGAVFIALRLGPLLTAPVAGAELRHLAGAWQASIGVDDARFVPTLIQSLAALTFTFTASELPARILAFAATATVPLALYLLRRPLGEAGSLLALLILCFEPAGLVLGATASAMGFDLAITAWLLVVVLRRFDLGWGWLGVGFLVATAGPLPLVLAVAVMGIWLARGGRRPSTATMLVVPGAVLGLIFATARVGLDVDGLMVPPLDLFSEGYEADTTTAAALELLALHGLPLVVPGALVAILAARAWAGGREPSPATRLLLAWTAVTGAWLVSSLADHTALPLAAIAFPLALLLGPAIVRSVSAMLDADWYYPRFLVPLAGLAAIIALTYTLDWARAERVGDAATQFRLWSLGISVAALLVLVGWNERARPVLFAFVLPLMVVPFVALGFAAVLPRGEPLASPFAPDQARLLRDTALALRDREAGTILVHPLLEPELTWAFRDSGDIVIASRPEASAAIILWPADLPAPEGFELLEGNWALTHEVETPTDRVLRGLHWLFDRNTLETMPRAIAVYAKAKE